MKKIFNFIFLFFVFSILISCQSVSKKIDKSVKEEEKKLSQWINQPESELKIVFGKPDKINFTDTGNKNYIYINQLMLAKLISYQMQFFLFFLSLRID